MARTRRKTQSSRASSSSRSGASGAATRRKTTRKATTARSNGGFTPRVAADPSDEVHAVYMVGLRNAQAVEKEALQVMQRQVERLQHYPDVSKRLRDHIRETEEQVKRLDRILESHGETASSLKNVVTQLMGNAAAIAHSIAGDEILKNAFANQALEAYEIAAYKSLIVMAMRQDDRKAVPLLKRTLAEEERMLKWADGNVAKVTLAYLDREASGRKADR